MANKKKVKKKDNPAQRGKQGGIPLHKETQRDLRELTIAANDILTRRDIIIRENVRAVNKEGNYRISKDFTRLEKIDG